MMKVEKSEVPKQSSNYIKDAPCADLCREFRCHSNKCCQNAVAIRIKNQHFYTYKTWDCLPQWSVSFVKYFCSLTDFLCKAYLSSPNDCDNFAIVSLHEQCIGLAEIILFEFCTFSSLLLLVKISVRAQTVCQRRMFVSSHFEKAYMEPNCCFVVYKLLCK